MQSALYHTTEGTAERQVATPYRKYSNSEDYIECIQYNDCRIYIGGTQKIQVTCNRGGFNMNVSW